MKDVTPGKPNSLHVLGLYAENVKRIKVVNIQPPATGLVKIAGANGQGKSSTLDAILFALGGKEVQPDVPIRTGTRHAKVILDLGELRVTRTWTDNDTTYLKVDRRGAKETLRKPHDFLEALIGAGLGLDPFDFVDGLTPAEQVSRLLELLQLPEDPRALDVQRKRLYDERTIVNRDVKTLEAKLAGMPEPAEDVPDEEVSVAGLATEHARLVRIHHANDEKRTARNRCAADVKTHRAKIADLEEQLRTARGWLQQAEHHLAEAEAALEGVVDPDLTAITARMQSAEALNAKVRDKKARADVAVQFRDKQKEAVDLTDAMEVLEAKKLALLAGATFPVPGLGFGEVQGEYRVTFHGMPLEQCADSEKWNVGLGIAMALNPRVRVVLIRRASLLDEATLCRIGERAADAGYQVWAELVGPGDAASFVLEDGGVIRMPANATAAAPADVFSEEE